MTGPSAQIDGLKAKLSEELRIVEARITKLLDPAKNIESHLFELETAMARKLVLTAVMDRLEEDNPNVSRR